MTVAARHPESPTASHQEHDAGTRVADGGSRRPAQDETPVIPGRFRASWTIGVGQVDTSVAPAAPARADGGVAEPRIPAITMGQTYYHANSLPYARRLEYGW